MATTEIKTLEKLVKEILEKVKNIGDKKSKENYDKAFEELNTKLETIDERLSVPKKEDTISAEIISKVDNINAKIEENAKNYAEEIQKAFDNYKKNEFDILYTDDAQNAYFKDFVSIITKELANIKNQFENFNTEFTDVNLNTGMAISKEIVSLKNHVLALNDSVENVKDKFLDEKSNIFQEICNNTFNSYKNDVYSVLAKITEASNNALKRIDDLSAELKTFEGLELSVGEIIQNQQKNKAEIIRIIQNNIKDENKRLLPQIMQIVNSVSFDENTEEIKDGLYAINENLGIVNKNIETESNSTEQILGQIDDISSVIKGDLVDKLSQMNVFLSDVSNDFSSLTKGSKGETDTYIYSLLDLESDISKVRLILDDLNKSIQNDRMKIENIDSFVEQTSNLYSSPDYKELLVQFDALNDDITSISRRTNKLILTSDDASEKLQNNIKIFQNIMLKINETVKNFEKSSILKTLNIRTENMQKMLKSTIQSDKAVNEAFIYLANWIDATSNEIKDIKKDLLTIKNKLETNAEQEKTDNSELNEIKKLLKETNKKFSNNIERIDSLEEKLNINDEFMTTIENISTQIQAMNKNLTANAAIAKKVDKMEKQIQQLLSYVEEDDE